MQSEDGHLPITPGSLQEEAQPWQGEGGDLGLSPAHLLVCQCCTLEAKAGSEHAREKNVLPPTQHRPQSRELMLDPGGSRRLTAGGSSGNERKGVRKSPSEEILDIQFTGPYRCQGSHDTIHNSHPLLTTESLCPFPCDASPPAWSRKS